MLLGRKGFTYPWSSRAWYSAAFRRWRDTVRNREIFMDTFGPLLTVATWRMAIHFVVTTAASCPRQQHHGRPTRQDTPDGEQGALRLRFRIAAFPQWKREEMTMARVELNTPRRISRCPTSTEKAISLSDYRNRKNFLVVFNRGFF